MQDILETITQADDRGEYLSTDQLKGIKKFFTMEHKRIDVIDRISKNASKIVNDTATALLAERPELALPGGSVYPRCQFAACLRDLDMILRWVTYVMLSRNTDILEDRVLNGLKETYLALGIEPKLMALSVQVMKLISIDMVSNPHTINTSDWNNIITELAAYFDYVVAAIDGGYPNEVANAAIQKLKLIRNKANEYKWEPSNYHEWFERDKLIQTLLKYEVENKFLFEESAFRFFQTWSQMPSQDKQEVWREREIMAALYDRMMQHWKNIPNFGSVAVAERMVDSKPQLAGILVFYLTVGEELGEEYYKLWNIPRYLKVESSITLLSEEEKLVPIQLEWISKRKFSKESIESLAIDAAPTTLLSVQSGDIIAGCKVAGRLNKAQAVTLTAFVIPQNSCDVSDVRLLTVGHGFNCGYRNIYTCEIEPPTKIGDITYNSPVEEEIAQKLDVSLIKPIDTLAINSYLKWADVIPKPPIEIARRGMLVQMYGGTSKHQTGYIDYCNIMDYGPISSAYPNFTAIIPALPGDSGALLVTGHGTSGDPDPDADGEARGYSQAYLNIRKFAMLGILIEGSTRATFQNVAIFRPIETVFQYLKVKPYLGTE